MHPINRVLTTFGLVMERTRRGRAPKRFREQYDQDIGRFREAGFEVYEAFRYDIGEHPISHRDIECAFAATHVRRCAPSQILDVGSYREFVIGLLAGYDVTSLDVRDRKPACANETVLTADVKSLDVSSGAFDMVTSLCALEHFGLGRYGDEVEIGADKRGFSEMIRVLKPGGTIVFTTVFGRHDRPSVAFNAHYIYTRDKLAEYCRELSLVEERFYSRSLGRFCSFDEVTTRPNPNWDLYCGCYRKPAQTSAS